MEEGVELELFRGFVSLVWSDRGLCRSVVEEYLLKVDSQLGGELSGVKSDG